MAEALLARHLAARALEGARVHSAGTLRWRGPATETACHAMAERGLDLTAHRSRALSRELLADADLVLGMTRDHVGRVVALDRHAVDRTFVIGEVVRLGRETGPRDLGRGQSVADWVAAVAARRPAGRAGPPGRAHDEIDDPIGQPLGSYRRTAARLDRLTGELADLLAGRPGTDPPHGERRLR